MSLLYIFSEELIPELRTKRDRRISATEWLIRALDAWCGYAGYEAVLVLPPAPGTHYPLLLKTTSNLFFPLPDIINWPQPQTCNLQLLTCNFLYPPEH